MMGRGIATACAVSTVETTEAWTDANTKCGSTNATAVTNGFSELGQHDIEHSIISPMSCSQSMCECCGAGAFWP